MKYLLAILLLLPVIADGQNLSMEFRNTGAASDCDTLPGNFIHDACLLGDNRDYGVFANMYIYPSSNYIGAPSPQSYGNISRLIDISAELGVGAIVDSAKYFARLSWPGTVGIYIYAHRVTKPWRVGCGTGIVPSDDSVVTTHYWRFRNPWPKLDWTIPFLQEAGFDGDNTGDATGDDCWLIAEDSSFAYVNNDDWPNGWGWMDWDITTLVQAWLDGDADWNGIVLHGKLGSDDAVQLGWATSNTSAVNERPYYKIWYHIASVEKEGWIRDTYLKSGYYR